MRMTREVGCVMYTSVPLGGTKMPHFHTLPQILPKHTFQSQTVHFLGSHHIIIPHQQGPSGRRWNFNMYIFQWLSHI